MKKLLFTTLVTMIGVLGTCASAARYEDYTYKVTNGEATIVDCIDNAVGAMVIPDTIEGYPVTAIDSQAFLNCKKIDSVTIPDSVTTIGSSAFLNCNRLDSITIPDSVTAIGDGAFSGCKSLVEVVIPNSVTSMGRGVFAGCAMIKSITIPDSVQSVGERMFANCTKLEKVILGENCASVGQESFMGCDAIISIEVDENNMHLSSLDGNLYNKDKTRFIQYALGKEDKSFTIPEGVATVDSRAFSWCEHIESVIFPKTIAYIGKEAFVRCDNLKIVSIAGGNGTVIDESAFSGCKKIERVILGNGVASIGENAFGFCMELKSLIIPGSVKTISDFAFWGCEKLETLILGDGVTTIGSTAFNQCLSISSITIPDSVSFIDEHSFSSIVGLDDIYYTGTEDDWKNIEIGAMNEALFETEIHYEYKPSAPVLEAECDVLEDSVGAYVRLGEDNSDVIIIGLFCDVNDKVLGVKTYTVTSEAGEAYLTTPDSGTIKKVKIMIVDNVASENLINETITVEVERKESDREKPVVKGNSK